jgi:hypothetical protein
MKHKLYAIVLVRHPEYHHFGEILSRITPQGTYMVRMVPGHPGTLREIAGERLMGTTGRIKYVHYAKLVQGVGAFPIDMLRYDHCAPLNFDPETLQINPLMGFDTPVVARASDRKDPDWTHERWRSFTWDVEPMRTERLEHQ